jgi:acetoin utilization protein AcuB
MFVADWMTRNVYTVKPEDSVFDALKILREKKIKHLPVVTDGSVVGLLSDRDIREFSPSKATALDVYEMHYILAKTTAGSIMRTQVFTTTPGTPVEQAAMEMLDRGIGCLPVVDHGKLVGIISDMDIFRVLVDITGIRHDGHRIFLSIDDRPGSIREVADVVRKHNFRIQSILTTYEKSPKGKRNVVLRTLADGDFDALKKDLLASFPEVQLS